MKQYKVTYNVDVSGESDCVLDPNDPIHAIKDQMFLGKVPGVNVYEIYPEQKGEEDRPSIPFGQH